LTVKQLVDREIDSPVLSAAVSVLGNIGEPAVPLLIDLLQHESTPKHETLQIRVRVVTELGDLGEKAELAVPTLLTFLNETVDKYESIEQPDCEQGFTGGSHALYRESNPLASALIAIIQALGKIGVDDPQVRKALRELAESSHGIGIQIPAWTALIRLSQKSSGIRDTLVSSLVERGDEAALQAIEATRDGDFVRTVVGKAFDELEVTAENAGWALRLCVALNEHDGVNDYLAKAQEVVRMVGSRPPSHYESRSMMERFLRLFEYLRNLE
jgi:HEAT repeat protein